MWLMGLSITLLVALLLRIQRTPARLLAGSIIATAGLLLGLLGSINPVLWACSTLDAYGPNENWWVSNPLTFALIPVAWTIFRRRESRFALVTTTLLALLATVGLLWDLSPFDSQDNSGFIGLVWPLIILLAWRARLTQKPR